MEHLFKKNPPIAKKKASENWPVEAKSCRSARIINFKCPFSCLDGFLGLSPSSFGRVERVASSTPLALGDSYLVAVVSKGFLRKRSHA